MASKGALRAGLDLSRWVLDLSDRDLDGALTAMELRRDENAKENVKRLMTLLAGDYEPEDFLANNEFDDEEELRDHRITLRNEYVEAAARDLGLHIDESLSRTESSDEEDKAAQHKDNPLANSTIGTTAAPICNGAHTATTTTPPTTMTTSFASRRDGIFSGLGGYTTESSVHPITTPTYSRDGGDMVLVTLPDQTTVMMPRASAEALHFAQLEVAYHKRNMQNMGLAPGIATNFASSTQLALGSNVPTSIPQSKSAPMQSPGV